MFEAIYNWYVNASAAYLNWWLAHETLVKATQWAWLVGLLFIASYLGYDLVNAIMDYQKEKKQNNT